METRKLRAGEGSLDVTALGFGGAPLGNLFAPVTDKDAEATVDAAWDAGIRYFDTAPFYGLDCLKSASDARFRSIRATNT